MGSPSSGLPLWSARAPRADRAMQLSKRAMQKSKVAIDRELIHELADLLEETGLDEIEQNGMRVRVARRPSVVHVPTPVDEPIAAAAAAPPVAVPMPAPAPVDPA